MCHKCRDALRFLPGVLLMLVLASLAYSEKNASGPLYQNTVPPECGSFHTRRIQGTVRDEAAGPLRNVDIAVYDDATKALLGRTVTDSAGNFSFRQGWRGRLRVVLYSDGFLRQDWAVTIVDWPDGGFRRARSMSVVLLVPWGDRIFICPKGYSR